MQQGQVLLLSKLFKCNLKRHDYKERIHFANKLKVASQNDKSYHSSGGQSCMSLMDVIFIIHITAFWNFLIL